MAEVPFDPAPGHGPEFITEMPADIAPAPVAQGSPAAPELITAPGGEPDPDGPLTRLEHPGREDVPIPLHEVTPQMRAGAIGSPDAPQYPEQGPGIVGGPTAQQQIVPRA